MDSIRTSRKVVYSVAALLIGVFVAGFVVASITISSGSETGNGNYTGATALLYWSEASVGLAGAPGALPTTLSGTAATPTVLAGASSAYGINTVVADDTEQYFKFTETTSAPVNTEVEIVFTVSTGAGTSTSTVYVETQSSAPGSALTFTLYYDLGSAASSNIVLNDAQQLSQQCSAVGTCP